VIANLFGGLLGLQSRQEQQCGANVRDASVVLKASSSCPERISRLAPASKRSPDVSAKHASDTLFTLTGAEVKHHPSKRHPEPSKTRDAIPV
jgi:hypothetical protein